MPDLQNTKQTGRAIPGAGPKQKTGTASTGIAKLLVLFSLPLIAGLTTLLLFVSPIHEPVFNDVPLSDPPSDFEMPSNSVTHPSRMQLQKFIADENLGAMAPQDARQLFLSKHSERGMFLFQKNCSHCHGTTGEGDGVFVRDMRLKPRSLVSGKRAASLSERYLYWRISEGYLGLPARAQPWHSSMPAWKESLHSEEIYEIILAIRSMAAQNHAKNDRRSVSARCDDQLRMQSRRHKLPARELEPVGKIIYENHCSSCHGTTGRGNGALADYLYPRPRDLTRNFFKFRTTLSEEYPTDEDLFKTICRGIPGTSMPAWGTEKPKLTNREIWAVIGHLKSLNPDFPNPAPESSKEVTASHQTSSRASKAMLKRGETLFKSEAGCYKCHGNAGRGDGPEGIHQKDNAGYPILPADLSKGWRYKNWGSTPEDIFRTISTGLNGTPMPGYYQALSEEDRWALAYYVASLIDDQAPGGKRFLVSKYLPGVLPTNDRDPKWKKAPVISIPLSAQLITRPRRLFQSVDQMYIRSFYNAHEIAFLLEWNDRVKNVVHEEKMSRTPEIEDDTYSKANYERIDAGTMRDAIAIQFPIRTASAEQQPHFLFGAPGNPVALWWWKADWQETPSVHHNGIEMVTAEGPDRTYPAAAQPARSHAAYADGQWRVTIIRALKTDNPKQDAQFEQSAWIPIAFHVWDGANDEHGLQHALSDWLELYLEPPTPLKAYLWAMLAMLAAAGMAYAALSRRQE